MLLLLNRVIWQIIIFFFFSFLVAWLYLEVLHRNFYSSLVTEIKQSLNICLPQQIGGRLQPTAGIKLRKHVFRTYHYKQFSSLFSLNLKASTLSSSSSICDCCLMGNILTFTKNFELRSVNFIASTLCIILPCKIEIVVNMIAAWCKSPDQPHPNDSGGCLRKQNLMSRSRNQFEVL